MSDAVTSDLAGLGLIVLGTWLIAPWATGIVAIGCGAICLVGVGHPVRRKEREG